MPKPEFARSFRDRLHGRVAERHEHAFRPHRLSPMQLGERLAKRVEPEVGFPFTAVHAVEKRGDVDELRARIHEVEIEDLLAGQGKK